MKFAYTLTVLLAVFFAISLNAHDGCHHAPGDIAAPHGGLIEETVNGHWIELVDEGNNKIKLFVYNHDIEPLPLKQFSIKAEATPPKKASVQLLLNSQQDHHIASTEALSQWHHYNVKVSLQIEGKNEEVSFVVER